MKNTSNTSSSFTSRYTQVRLQSRNQSNLKHDFTIFDFTDGRAIRIIIKRAKGLGSSLMRLVIFKVKTLKKQSY